jgi:hypothetical protein
MRSCVIKRYRVRPMVVKITSPRSDDIENVTWRATKLVFAKEGVSRQNTKISMVRSR